MRDDTDVQLGLGILLPVALLLWLSFDLWAGAVYLPGPKHQRFPLRPVSDALLFNAIVTMKLGAVIGLFNWYWLANRQRFDRFVLDRRVFTCGGWTVDLNRLLSRCDHRDTLVAFGRVP